MTLTVGQEFPSTDLYFILRDPNTGAAIARWALDDPETHNLVSDIHLRGQVPGGKKEAMGSLPRDPSLNWADLVKYADVEVCGPGRELYWSGRFNKAPKVSGERMSITGVCVGWQAALEDNKAVIGPGFIDPDQSKWGEPSAQRRANLKAANVEPAASVSVGWQGAGDEPPGVCIDFTNVETLEGKRMRGEAWYHGGGVPLGGLLYQLKVLAGPEGGATWVDTSHLSLDDIASAFQTGPEHDATTSGYQRVNADSNSRYHAVVYSDFGDGGGTPMTDLHAWQHLKVISRLAQLNLDLQGTWPNVGYNAKQILSLMVPLIAPPLEVNDEALDDDGYVITSAWFADPQAPAEKVRDVCKYSPYLDWFVRKRRLFERRFSGTYGKRWHAYASRSDFTEEGEDGERLWESITGRGTDSSGRSFTVGRPGSGATIESDLLQITDPDHPAVKAPVTRNDLLDFQGVVEPGPLIEACAEFLREANELSRSGQATLGWVQDETGAFHPPQAVQEGDEVFFNDVFDRSGRKVVDYDFGKEAGKVVVSLDAPSEGLQALQERYRAALIPLGVG